MRNRHHLRDSKAVFWQVVQYNGGISIQPGAPRTSQQLLACETLTQLSKCPQPLCTTQQTREGAHTHIQEIWTYENTA